MTKSLKKHDFSLQLERLFTREETDVFDLIHFVECDPAGDDSPAAFEKPDNWSDESTAALAEAAAHQSIPAYTRSIEENTVPSWLWRRVGEGRLRSCENSVKQIFHRVAGAATYTGWKKDVFADETEARTFFDEIRYMLAQRFIAFEPRHLATQGLDWVYGIEKKTSATAPREMSKAGFEIRNAGIDALLGGDKPARRKWQKILEGGAKSGFLQLSFSDVAADWNSATSDKAATRAAVNLLVFRREDGGVDIDRLSHAVKLLTILFELQEYGSIAINLHNLAAVVMSQGIPYDRDAGRATAAALAAIVTAEACATSAQLAGLLGPSLDFAANREGVLRALRNHRRAAYGDRNDYEKISVLPAPLALDPGADLALIASARRRWDEALELVKQHGLRFIRFTDFSALPELAFFMESVTQGSEPMPELTTEHVVYPAVTEGLVKLGYDPAARRAFIAHVTGTGTLADAPGIDHAALRARGFDDDALEKMEEYLPQVNNIRFAFTPWILGEEFIRDTLRIPADRAQDPHFDLLQQLGFSAADIDAANEFCYGTGSVRGAKELRPEHLAVFAQGKDISAAARIRMAAAVQGFISGDAGLNLTIPAGVDAAEAEHILLAAWRQGIKSVGVEFAASQQRQRRMMPRPAPAHGTERSPRVPLPEYKAPVHSVLRGRPKASGQIVGLEAGHKSTGKKRGQSQRGDKNR